MLAILNYFRSNNMILIQDRVTFAMRVFLMWLIGNEKELRNNLQLGKISSEETVLFDNTILVIMKDFVLPEIRPEFKNVGVMKIKCFEELKGMKNKLLIFYKAKIKLIDLIRLERMNNKIIYIGGWGMKIEKKGVEYTLDDMSFRIIGNKIVEFE